MTSAMGTLLLGVTLTFLGLCHLLDATRIHSYPKEAARIAADAHATMGHDKKMICYYGSWAVYRPGDGKFPVENIDGSLCTHLIYGFTGLGYDNTMRVLDAWNDLEDNYGKGAFKRFNNLKRDHPHLKTLIAIGGWNEGSLKYSNMAADPAARATFIASVVAFLDKYGFDGLDMDWEYPAARGGKPADKENFVRLLAELSAAFKSKGYLLTAATSAGKWFAEPAYDIPQVSKYLDLINVMAYDYHGGWEDRTGHNAPLYARPDESGNDRLNNVNFSVNYWLSQGAPREKIMLGMGTYGRSFTLERAEKHGLNAMAPQKGAAGPYTREGGSLGYNEICEMQSRQKWTVVRDKYSMAPYAFHDRQWVGYDDVESITLKARYIKALDLGGGMIWSVETDDFQGKCHGEKYPLLKAIHREFRSSDRTLPLPDATGDADEDDESGFGSTSTTTTTTTKKPTTESWNWRPSSSSSTTETYGHEGHGGSSSTTSTTTTTTTTTTTARPNGGGAGRGKCHTDGMYRDPSNCQKFYRCVYNGYDYTSHEYNCPSGTVFDNESKLCVWAHQIPECAHHAEGGPSGGGGGGSDPIDPSARGPGPIPSPGNEIPTDGEGEKEGDAPVVPQPHLPESPPAAAPAPIPTPSGSGPVPVPPGWPAYPSNPPAPGALPDGGGGGVPGPALPGWPSGGPPFGPPHGGPSGPEGTTEAPVASSSYVPPCHTRTTTTSTTTTTTTAKPAVGEREFDP